MSGQRKPALTGGCQCGAVRYALYAEPQRAGVCHCRMCQKAVGGPFMAWATVGMGAFRLDPVARQADSSALRLPSGVSALVAARRCASPMSSGLA